MKVLVKYRLKSFNVVIDKDKRIWREPFKSGLRNYDYKELFFKEHQGILKLRIKGDRYTKDQLFSKLIKVEEYHYLPIEIEDCPF